MLGSLIERGVREATKTIAERAAKERNARQDRRDREEEKNALGGLAKPTENPWEMGIFGPPTHMRGGQPISQAESDKRYTQAYGDEAMADVIRMRDLAARKGYGSIGEMNYYERDDNPKGSSPQMPNTGGFPWPGFPQFPFPMPSYPQPQPSYPQYPQQPGNGGINPGGMYGGGQMWAGGTPHFHEQTGQYNQPQNQYNQLQQQILQLQQQMMQPQQSGMNWDMIFSAMMPMIFGGGMGGFGGFNPYGGMGNMYGGGYGNSPYGGFF